MQLRPRYEGPSILIMDGPADDQLLPLTRQRRRLQALLRTLDEEQWMAPSRCEAWTVRDVIAHLVGVNAFWHASVLAGLKGNPTRVLAGFDPAATPPLMVDSMKALTCADVLAEFISTNEAFLDLVAGLTLAEWSTPVESPPGHVPVRLLAQHALWDCWIHERDIAIPLAISPIVEVDEVTSCLRYAAAVGPALGLELGVVALGTYAIEATDPVVRFVLDVGDSVVVRNDDHCSADVPCLRGDAVALTEALSLRAAMPPAAPGEWTRLGNALVTAFDAA